MAFDRIFEGPPTTGAPASASLGVDLTNKTLYVGGGSLIGWQQIVAGGTPSGSAGGDLSGTYPNPVVAQINGAAVPVSASVVGTNSSGQLISVTNITGATINATIGFVAAGTSSSSGGYGFSALSTARMFTNGFNELALTEDGANIAFLSGSTFQAPQIVAANAGSATLPAVMVPHTHGLYSISASTMGISCGGTSAATLTATLASFAGNSQSTGIILTSAAPTVAASQLGLGSTTSSTATAGSATLPLAPVGFLVANLAGTTVKIPYYAT